MSIMVPILHQGCNLRRRRGVAPRRSHRRKGISGRGTLLRRPLLPVIRATSTTTILRRRHLGTLIISTMRTLAAFHFSSAVWVLCVAVACSNNAAIASELLMAFVYKKIRYQYVDELIRFIKSCHIYPY